MAQSSRRRQSNREGVSEGGQRKAPVSRESGVLRPKARPRKDPGRSMPGASGEGKRGFCMWTRNEKRNKATQGLWSRGKLTRRGGCSQEALPTKKQREKRQGCPARVFQGVQRQGVPRNHPEAFPGSQAGHKAPG